MFGRKDKKAISSLPPLHQGLVNDQVLVASLQPAEWQSLLASLQSHDQFVKKHHLPPRTLDFLLPLLRILLEDVPRDGYLSVRADLSGPEGKAAGPMFQIPPPHAGIKSIKQTMLWDPWLSLEAKLTNRAKLDLQVADAVRHRQIHKRCSSGKWKVKDKRKSTQRVRVRLSVPGTVPVAPPAGGVPPWCRITMEQAGDRTHLDGRSKYPIVTPEHKKSIFSIVIPQSPGAPTHAQLNNVLLLLGEVFRWVPKSRPSQAAS